MKICFVGSSNTIFTHSYLKLFSLIGEDISFIDIGKEAKQYVRYVNHSKVFRLYEDKLKLNKESVLKRFLVKLKLDRNPILIFILSLINTIKSLDVEKENDLKDFLLEHNPDIIVFFWGTTVRCEKKAISKIINGSQSFKPKSLLVVNTYPVQSDVGFHSKYFFSFFDSYFFKSFDGISFPSRHMKAFFDNNKIPYKSFNILPDFLSSDIASSNCFEIGKETRKNKKIVFLGNTDFNSRTIDNVYNELKNISNFDVEVWMQYSEDINSILNENPNENIKLFSPFTYDSMLNGDLNIFLSEFDAVIMTYNGINNARTSTGFPTRFALALSAKIPIFVKSNTFLFLEEEFEQIIVPYIDVPDFINKLSISEYKCVEFPLYIESYAEHWNKFLHTL